MSELRRLGLIGDVHAEDELLAMALDYLARQAVDQVLCVGDVVDGRGSVDRCVELLQQHRVATVRGNHDRWMLLDELRDLKRATMRYDITRATRDYLRELPATRRFEIPGGVLCLAHSIGTDDMTFINDATDFRNRAFRARASLGIGADVRIHVGGHTHRPWAAQVGRTSVINAGTLRWDDLPCFAVLDVSARTFVVQLYHVDESGVQEAERVLL